MRLKLVFVASLLAALLGAGSVVTIVLLAFASLAPLTQPGLLVLSTFLLPLITTFVAAVFVYRHTAKRRRLQAALTAIISLLLTLAFFLSASVITARLRPLQHEPGLQRNAG